MDEKGSGRDRLAVHFLTVGLQYVILVQYGCQRYDVLVAHVVVTMVVYKLKCFDIQFKVLLADPTMFLQPEL